eukprot:656495_1
MHDASISIAIGYEQISTFLSDSATRCIASCWNKTRSIDLVDDIDRKLMKIFTKYGKMRRNKLLVKQNKTNQNFTFVEYCFVNNAIYAYMCCKIEVATQLINKQKQINEFHSPFWF